jgi:hypothetical protein
MALSTRPYYGTSSDALGASQDSNIDQAAGIAVAGNLAAGSDLRLGIDQDSATRQLPDLDVLRVGNGGHHAARVGQATAVDDAASADISVVGGRPVEVITRGRIDQDSRDRADASVSSEAKEVLGEDQVEIRGDQYTDVELRGDVQVEVEMDDDGTIVAEIDFDLESDIEADLDLDVGLERDGDEPRFDIGFDQESRTRMDSDVDTYVRDVDGIDVGVSFDQWATIDQGAGAEVVSGGGALGVDAGQLDAVSAGNNLGIVIDTH